MRPTTETLLEELANRWAHGKPLAVDELLARAGPQADELADLIDRFLLRAPRREPTPEALAYVRSLDEPSLLRARQEKRLKLDDLTDLLVEKLGLPTFARAKVRRHYQDLELGKLDPRGVAGSVWDVLTGLLGSDARRLAAISPPTRAAPAMFRAGLGPPRRKPAARLEWLAQSSESFELRREKPAASRRTGSDEVDRLFGVDPPD
jgi:hypothetical protein